MGTRKKHSDSTPGITVYVSDEDEDRKLYEAADGQVCQSRRDALGVNIKIYMTQLVPLLFPRASQTNASMESLVSALTDIKQVWLHKGTRELYDRHMKTLLDLEDQYRRARS